jgi:hypothetical protein
MRKGYLFAATVAACLVGGCFQVRTATAADASAGCDCQTSTHCGCRQNDDCQSCGHGNLFHGGLGVHVDHVHLHRLYDGADLYYNCGCNGSYKFPVPPLYTYHWPGMYSRQLMTDYQSPWRFPPLRPYTEEPDPVKKSTVRAPAALRSVSTTPSTARRQSEAEIARQRSRTMSERARELYR